MFALQKTEELRSLLQMKFSKNAPEDEAVHLAFRFPDGKKLEYVFEEKDPTMVSPYSTINFCVNFHCLCVHVGLV